MKILVVDDSGIVRKIVIRTLRQAGFGGHDVEEAENGVEALEKDAPDVVLFDWNMPEMTGIELARAMNEKDLNIPFAFITSECTAEMREQANEAGAIAFLTKPFTAETMNATLGKILD